MLLLLFVTLVQTVLGLVVALVLCTVHREAVHRRTVRLQLRGAVVLLAVVGAVVVRSVRFD